MQWVNRAALAAGVVAAAGGAQAQTKQQVTGPVATYWMSAQTSSGFGGMMGGGGRGPSAASMMGAMMGGGGSNVSKTLVLQLGSSRKPAGDPAAEHLPPSVLQAGQSLPLLTPRAQPRQRDEEPGVMPKDYKPKGRMLIFWGCGETVGPGQPVIIDFSK